MSKHQQYPKLLKQSNLAHQLLSFQKLNKCDADCGLNTKSVIYKCKDCGSQFHNRYQCQLFIISNRGNVLCQDCWNLNF